MYRVELPVTTDWTHQRVLFGDLQAVGSGSIDAARLRSLQLLFYPEDYEAWVDDVAFVPR